MESVPAEVVEDLAIMEHEAWVRERLESGWSYATEKNVEQKLTPYLIPLSLIHISHGMYYSTGRGKNAEKSGDL